MSTKRIIVGTTGGSGAIYLVQLVKELLISGVQVHLVASDYGRRVLFEEMNIPDLEASSLGVEDHSDRLIIYNNRDLGSRIASGSFIHDGMIVVPCSSNTLGAVASGITNTLVQRAAAVTLKEQRKLVLAHRETPVNLIDLRNMCAVTEAGAIVSPLSPGFYMNPKGIRDLADFMVGKMIDAVGIHHELQTRWDPMVH
ncbi:MAG: UbiX family flavin prenyltransferase [Phycisphaerales bacterium]|jgi:4-hydroxy-3-polyprenylbenzoate decarboxylase|nr:UbiX family flavin prenyltransferase [Phycisphaerales bacterium]